MNATQKLGLASAISLSIVSAAYCQDDQTVTTKVATNVKAKMTAVGSDLDPSELGIPDFSLNVMTDFKDTADATTDVTTGLGNSYQDNKRTGGAVMDFYTGYNTRGGAGTAPTPPVPALPPPPNEDHGYAIGTYGGTAAGALNLSTSYSVNWRTVSVKQNSAATRTVQSRARYIDPFNFPLEADDYGARFEMILEAGTEVQQIGDGLTVAARFGLGTFAPDSLWTETIPPSVVSPYSLSLIDDNGALEIAELSATDGPLDPDGDGVDEFSVSFGALATSSDIMNAGWTVNGGKHLLLNDLPLFDFTVTIAGSHDFDFGAGAVPFSIGLSTGNTAFAAVPEPSAFCIFASLSLLLVGKRRRKIRTFYFLIAAARPVRQSAQAAYRTRSARGRLAGLG